MYTDPTVERRELEWKTEHFCHLFNETVDGTLKRCAKLSTVTVDLCGHNIIFQRDHCNPVCQVANPLSYEKLQVELTQRCLSAAQSALPFFRWLAAEAHSKRQGLLMLPTRWERG